MRTRHISVTSSLISIILFAGSLFGRSQVTAVAQTHEFSNQKVGAIADSTPDEPTAKKVPQQKRRDDLQNEVETLKAENAAVRGILQKMQEQQKQLLETVTRLQQRLDGNTLADAKSVDQAAASQTASQRVNNADEAQPVSAGNSSPQPARVANQDKPQKEDRYQDGIVIYQNSDDAKVPFLLKFNNNTQIRFLNTMDSKDTYTDHLGVVREVHKRNDITVNRSMFILGGYMFDKRLQYSLTVWTSAGAASIVVAGNIGWRFNKQLTVTGGYTGVPGSRSLVSTFPFFQPIDRSMADNFFRPGFTQGVWANGELFKGFSYLAFVGNGLNTLNVFGEQDRYQFGHCRQCLVGTARSLFATRQIVADV